MIEQEMRKVTRHNVVKQASFSDCLADLMRRYTNQNLSAAEIIAKLVELAREVSADWVSRDDVRAKIRSTIKRLLAKHGYPPDGRDAATILVLRQMETFADEWSPEA